MGDPSCLASPTCEETKSIYYHSDVPSPLLDESMVEDELATAGSLSSPPVESLSLALTRSHHPGNRHRRALAPSTKAVHKFRQSSGVKSKLVETPPLGDGLPEVFTESMQSVVDNTMRTTWNQALGAYDRANLLGRDIWTLRDSWELDDDIINIYFILI